MTRDLEVDYRSCLRQVERLAAQGQFVWRCESPAGAVSHACFVKVYKKPPRIGSVHDLLRVHELARQANPIIAAGTPKLLCADKSRNAVVMEFIEGTALHRLLSPWWHIYTGRTCELLRSVARVCFAIHSFRGIETPNELPDLRNGACEPYMRSIWHSPLFQDCLPMNHRSFESLAKNLQAGWRERDVCCLVPIDAQPKNVVVRTGDQVVLVDPDYYYGNPAMNVGLFLMSLDRLSLRFPFLSRHWVRTWKGAFLDGYLCQFASISDRALLAEDLRVYYPRAILWAYEWHVKFRPSMRWYLSRFYAKCLTRFLDRLPVDCESDNAVGISAFTA